MPFFVDQAQGGAGNAQAHPAVLARPRNGGIARQEPALGFVVGVETLFPTMGFLPVTSQTRAMRTPDTYNGCLRACGCQNRGMPAALTSPGKWR